MDSFNYIRRKSSAVEIGNIPLGGDNPIRIQSMTSTSTLDTEGSVAQCKRIFDAGADYVRLTAQGVREAENIGVIRQRLHDDGYTKPLVADIHFNPKAAFAAAVTTDKVRINPGNFVDAARTFKKLEYTDEEYREEIQKIDKALIPFLEICREHNTAVRLGVNHGSLSDRIMSRYGDTPAGMVESAMEFLRICCRVKFYNVVISIKASNTVIMVETVRRLIKAMDEENMHFPLHLGVTEAGDGEDGRIKSAVGIGALLSEGIGDTIRVSLSEDPELEIPVARKLVDYITARAGHAPIHGTFAQTYNYIEPQRRTTKAVGPVGGGKQPVVLTALSREELKGYKLQPDYTLEECRAHADGINWMEADASADAETVARAAEATPDTVILLTSRHQNPVGELQSFIHRLTDCGCTVPVVVRMSYNDSEAEDVQIKAGADFGTLFINRLADGRPLVLITGHRRENFGDGFINMCTAIKQLTERYPNVDFVYPMHLNPNVRRPIHEVFGDDLSNLGNMHFIEPLEYLSFVYLMEKSTIVLTDSGGIQEEAPGLGKPVLVMRDTTERPEALEAGTVKLVGTDREKIFNEVSTLLDDAAAYARMSQAVNPYGDGLACSRIVERLK